MKRLETQVTICALVFFATTINYLDRSVISLLKPYLEKEFSWSEIDYSNISNMFSGCVCNLVCLLLGVLLTKIGTKLGYALFTFSMESLCNWTWHLQKALWFWRCPPHFLGLSEAGKFSGSCRQQNYCRMVPEKRNVLWL